MSAGNSIVRDGDPGGKAGATGFDLPADLATRYDVRIVDGADGEQRIGLFRAGDGERPSIEISDGRIAARREDPETIAALVKIAQQSGWDRIAVDGSPEFRQAVWEAGTRAGLSVSGYQPDFAEHARAEQARREAADQRPPASVASADPAARNDGKAAIAGEMPVASIAVGDSLSDGDRRLLLTLSRYTEDRRGLQQDMRPNMDAFEREVQYERLDANRGALDTALAQALESPTLVEAFRRSGYEPDTLRSYGKGGAWDGEVADAIYLVRSGLHRDTLAQKASPLLADAVDRHDDGRPKPSGARDDRTERGAPDGEDSQRGTAVPKRREGDQLAELFLHGPSDRAASDPRLAHARRAQAVMERHIGKVFDGDVEAQATANLESRHLISDALRRGLEVSVRQPTPVRQIEPAHERPGMER